MEGTNNINNRQNTNAQGFAFYTEQDADLANLEQKKIDYLEGKMDYSNPEQILQIYNKAIHDRIFKSPVGILYLRKLQMYLLKQESIDKEMIVPIPLYQSFTGEVRREQNPARNRVKPSERKEKKSSALPISVSLNLLLALAIIIMFVITLNSNQPNILNYERLITNQYASWEQELTEREQTVREKERELKIGTQGER